MQQNVELTAALKRYSPALLMLPPMALCAAVIARGDAWLVVVTILTVIAMSLLAYQLKQQNRRLLRYRCLARKLVHIKRIKSREEKRALRILNHIVNPDDTTVPETNIWQTPLYGFSGDLAIVSESEDGLVYALLADLTGHGITAAMGATPVASIFKATARRGLSVAEIIEELNNRLQAILPSGFFCCAAVLVADRTNGTLYACNAGLPEIIVSSSDGTEIELIPSSQLPLGIQTVSAQDVTVTKRSYTSAHQVYAFSDGLIESPGEKPDLFDLKTLTNSIRSLPYRPNGRLQQIVAERARRTQEIKPGDDISIVEVAIC